MKETTHVLPAEFLEVGREGIKEGGKEGGRGRNERKEEKRTGRREEG